MKPRLLRCAGPQLAVVAVAFVASACFDAHQVDPGSLVIDNFDDGAFPTDSMFRPWICYSFNPINQKYSCAFDADHFDDSARSLRLDFTVTDPMAPGPQYGGAGLATRAARGLYLDVTAFAWLGFDAELQSGIPQLPSDVQFSVHLGCSKARLSDGSQPGTVSVVQTITYNDNEWHERVVSLAHFSPLSPSTGPPIDIEGGVAGCLQRVDDIGFDVEAGLADGQTGAGTLKIDNLYLK